MDVARLLAPFETPLPPPRLCGIALVNPKTALRGTQYAGMMNRGNFGSCRQARSPGRNRARMRRPRYREAEAFPGFFLVKFV